MPDNDSIARKFARVLADPETNSTEAAEARTDLEILARRGSIFAREVLEQFPAVQVHTETERPVLGASPLNAMLAAIDALSEANRLENIRVAPIRAERRAALEAAFTSHGVPQSWQHGYRRTLEIYQSDAYSFADETPIFNGLLKDIAERWKHAKRV